jgi:hypothetical protein
MGKQARARAASASASLATAAATVALSDAAHATTFNESTDFGNDFASKTLLPAGTDAVNASVFPFEGDPADVITFQSLTPGTPFSLATTNTGDNSTNVFNVQQLNDSGSPVQGDSGTAASLAGTIPASGELHFSMFVEGGPSAGVFYTLDLTAVPEPGSAALLGGGLLAAATLRRFRARHGP